MISGRVLCGESNSSNFKPLHLSLGCGSYPAGETHLKVFSFLLHFFSVYLQQWPLCILMTAWIFLDVSRNLYCFRTLLWQRILKLFFHLSAHCTSFCQTHYMNIDYLYCTCGVCSGPLDQSGRC